MGQKTKELVAQLFLAVLTQESEAGLLSAFYDITDELEKREDAFEAVELVLRLMEVNPDVAMGNPGPLVHFVEKFCGQGYEQLLVASLERKPVRHTVWMLNRIINVSTGAEKAMYMKLMKDIAGNPDGRETVKEDA